MFPCCWTAAIVALLASLGFTLTKSSIGLLFAISAFSLALVLIYKKLKANKTKSCCHKK